MVENRNNTRRMSKVREDEERKRLENENEKKRMSKVREDEERKKVENENQKKRMSKAREDKERKKVENEKQKRRMSKAREDDDKKKLENEKQKTAKRAKHSEKRNPYKLIAVRESQENYVEGNISDDLKNSSVGYLFDESNQCKYCKAFRFKKERNFCCSQGDVVLPQIPEPPKQLKALYSKKAFTDNIRGYNNILAMASIGCETPDHIKGPNFKVQGKVTKLEVFFLLMGKKQSFSNFTFMTVMRLHI